MASKNALIRISMCSRFTTYNLISIYFAGMLQAQIGKNEEEANKAFSAAVQMHDTLVKAWALWGDYLETIFTNNPANIR